MARRPPAPKRPRFSRFDRDPQPPPGPTDVLVASAAPPAGTATVAITPTGGAKSKRKELVTSEAMTHQSVHLRRLNDSLTSAAMIMDPEKAPLGGYPAPNAVTRTWQHAAWGYRRSVPELNGATMFVGNCMSRCKLVVGKRNPDGSVEQGFDGEEPAEGLDPALAAAAAELIAQLQMPRGGQSELLRSLGEKLFMVGEAYAVPEGETPHMVFEILSTQELMPDGKRYKRYYGPGWGTEDLPEGTLPIRIWRADGQYQMLSTSSVQSCLEVLEELVVLTRLVRASAISRMSLAGVLVIPDELDNPDEEGGPDGDQSEAKNPLLVEMINTGAKAIDDPASAAAWMPFILQGPAEFIEKVRHIPFQADDHENVIKRTEAVERLARGLDLPPEKILGHMGTTFTNALQIDQDNFNIYIEPTLQLICDALTATYLWPMLAMSLYHVDPERLAEVGLPEEVMGVAITYDARKLVSKPDRAKEIIDVFIHDLTHTGVKIAELREALGLDPEDGPGLEETAMRIDAYRLGRIREVIQAPPEDAAVPIEDASAGNAPIPGQTAGARLAGRQKPSTNGGAPSGAAEEEALLASAALDPLRQLALQISGAAAVTISSAVRKYGTRLQNAKRGKAMSDGEKAAVAQCGPTQAARRLGPDAVARILGPNDDPSLADLNSFEDLATGWARQAECADPESVGAESATIVATLVRRALYEDPIEPTPDLFAATILGVRVPA